MVIRETFSSAASCRLEGTFCPGRNRPPIMADRNQSYNWTYIGFDGSLSTRIGGKKPGLTSFILRGEWLCRFSTEPFFCRASSGAGESSSSSSSSSVCSQGVCFTSDNGMEHQGYR